MSYGHREGRHGQPIKSTSIRFGDHAERTAYRDDRYQKCSKCGFTLNADRHVRGNDGDRSGTGITITTHEAGDPTAAGWDETWGSLGWGASYYYGDPTVNSGCPFCGTLMY